nr:DUF4157 domain-containing protein [Streptomyces sp. WM6378]
MLRQAGHPWAQPQFEQHQHNAGCGHQGEKPAVQRSAVHDVLRTSGRPLDDATRGDMEARLGADFSDVRIHDDGAAKASAAEVGARAYTSGSHIVVGEGGADNHTLAHELTHVIQQRQGPVAGTDNGAGLRVSDPSDRFEREAEATAQQAMALPTAVQRHAARTAPGPLPAPASPAQPVVQRAWTQGTMQGDDPVFQPDGGRAGTVRVTNLRGIPLGDGANHPTNAGDPIGWAALLSQGLQLGGQMPQGNHYNAVRMHLWNGRLGGPGNNRFNLAPGPALVNSQMSAQAENPVKDLVAYGYTVDLMTQVTYQNGPGNPLDLSTVVPNHISMTWQGRKAQHATVNETWSSHITLPVAAIAAAAIQHYQNLPATLPAAQMLLTDLATRSDQFRGEVLTLVQPFLKRHIMEAYPHLYRAQTAGDKGAFLMLLPAADRHAFLNLVLAGDENAWLEHCFGPLIAVGHNAAVQDAFATRALPQQREWIVRCVTDRHVFLAALGFRADAIASQDKLVYDYYPPAERARLAEAMHGQGLINGFLQNVCRTDPEKMQVLTDWAQSGSAQDPVGFLDARAHLDQVYKDGFRQRMNTLAAAEAARTARPTRSQSRLGGF